MKAMTLDREQKVYVVRLILLSALDRIESGLPDCIEWEDRLHQMNGVDKNPLELTAYERGGIETAGMALSVLYADTKNDGMGISDVLDCTGFLKACQAFAGNVWRDKGVRFNECHDRAMKQPPHDAVSLYKLFDYPDVDAIAEQFVAKYLD